jgi:Uma2 family endonuclease
MSEAVVAKRRATYQDVLDAPEHMVAEIVHGALHLHPRPGPKHTDVGSILGMKLGPPFRLGDGGPGGWWIMDEPELHLGDDILVPDLAAWRRERMPVLPETAYFEVPPDWVCEILSPSTRQFDVGEKRAIYARHGVGHLWQVDPDARTLEAFALEGGRWVLVDTLTDAAAVTLPPFDAVGFALADLWA